jgi:NADPH2:quinone reductase
MPSIARVLPLSEAAEAHRILEDREVRGTLLLNTTAN